MRLTKKLAGEATDELLGILADYPSGLRTSELSGTRRFHGEELAKQFAEASKTTPIAKAHGA
jgi:hypothetical protein